MGHLALLAIDLPTNTLIAIAVAGVVVIALAVALLRGNFSTPQRRRDRALHELLNAAEVPKTRLAVSSANSLGHNGDTTQLRGAGGLWLGESILGFVLRKPMRRFDIPLHDIHSAVASNEFSRVGLQQTSDHVDFLVIRYSETTGMATIGFRVANAEQWAQAVTDAVSAYRRRR